MEKLVEIKKGETGRGLLIERDGHLNAHQDMINQIREDISHHKEYVIPDRFIVNGVFQRYDALNHNGRIYPKNILVPEIDRYIKEAVNNRCAFGSLDHPECIDNKTYILTKFGWKLGYELSDDEEIVTMNPETRDFEIKNIIRKIESPYKGTMIHFKGEYIDIKVTPNHRFPIYDMYKKYIGFYTAQDILKKNIPDQNHCNFASRFDESDILNENIYNDNLTNKKLIDYISLSNETLEIFEEYYDDFVYCVEVENHTFYAMSNGKCLWSGNSSNLSGHDVSHNIIELHWEGPTLVGQMELQLTPGYKKYGVASTSGDLVANLLINDYLIGVSSRALGNVVQKYGQTYVDDSLEIVAFDVVLTPSTNCAYISPNPEDVQKFVQMNKTNPISESIKKIKKMLL